MSDYEIGKEMAQLQERVASLEAQIEDLMEFTLDCQGASQDEAYLVEIVSGAAAELDGEAGDASRKADLAPPSAAQSLRFTFGASTCHAMEHKGSWLRIWDNGSWQSHCTLKDRSRHSKWGNAVTFYITDSNGRRLANLADPFPDAWLGNFSPGEEKSYSGRGSSAGLQAHYKDISQGKLTLVRNWRCWRR